MQHGIYPLKVLTPVALGVMIHQRNDRSTSQFRFWACLVICSTVKWTFTGTAKSQEPIVGAPIRIFYLAVDDRRADGTVVARLLRMFMKS